MISNKRRNAIRNYQAIKKSIRAKCFDCMGRQKKTDCELKDCSLYSFRPWADK